jgi:3-carboxy-cis,cis-muconate cycloisomerase
LGGAIGTFSAMGGKGAEVERLVAHQLGLAPAGLPSRSSYDRCADYVAALGLLAGTVERIGQNIVFMQRTEIGELQEAFHLGKVGSSTMAQKRNPSTALMLISMSRMLRARVGLVSESMVRLDEGDSSASNVSDCTLPEIALLAVGLAENLAKLACGLVIRADAMRRNAGLTNGLIVSEAVMMRLTETMGRHHAHHLVYEAAQRAISEGVPFLQAIQEHPLLREKGTPATLAQALAVDSYIGESARLVDEVVARVRRPPGP